MTKSDFVKRISKSTGLTQIQSGEVLEKIADEIGEILINGDFVHLEWIGKFKTKKSKAREGRNPANGEKVHIPEKIRATFLPGLRLKAVLNGK